MAVQAEVTNLQYSIDNLHAKSLADWCTESFHSILPDQSSINLNATKLSGTAADQGLNRKMFSLKRPPTTGEA